MKPINRFYDEKPKPILFAVRENGKPKVYKKKPSGGSKAVISSKNSAMIQCIAYDMCVTLLRFNRLPKILSLMRPFAMHVSSGWCCLHQLFRGAGRCTPDPLAEIQKVAMTRLEAAPLTHNSPGKYELRDSRCE